MSLNILAEHEGLQENCTKYLPKGFEFEYGSVPPSNVLPPTLPLLLFGTLLFSVVFMLRSSPNLDYQIHFSGVAV